MTGPRYTLPDLIDEWRRTRLIDFGNGPVVLPAISLWQPWASLMAAGVKTIETRGYRCPRSMTPLVICSTATVPSEVWRLIDSRQGAALRALCEKHLPDWRPEQRGLGLPQGAALTVVRQMISVPTHLCAPPSWGEHDDGDLPVKGFDVADPEHDQGDTTVLVSVDNWNSGDYGYGRWAWLTEDNRPLADPIPVKGRQRLWSWTVPNLEVGA